MSTPHVWAPSNATRAAGERARVRYLGPRRTEPGEQRAPSPALVAFRSTIVRAWPGVSSGGLERDQARRGDASMDPHRDGIAVDFMLREGPERIAQGDALASWLVEHADELGVQYVLWSRTEWSASGYGARWEPYTGSNPHVDHVHAELGPDARAWSAEVMRAKVLAALARQERSPWPGVALALACAVGAWVASTSTPTDA